VHRRQLHVELIQHCDDTFLELGAPLARLEAQIALPRILQRMPDLRMLEVPGWRPTFTLQGVAALQLAA
jgi:cytochrome P450